MSYEFKPGEYKMRNGRKAVVLSDKYHDGVYTLVGVHEWRDGRGWALENWTKDGKQSIYSESEHDLMPPLVHTWRNVYADVEFGLYAHTSRESADSRAYKGRVAVLCLTHTHNGEFVSVELEKV